MSNRLYSKYKAAVDSFSAAGLSAAIDLATDTIKIAALSSSYTPNTATDQFWSSASAALVGTAVTLTHASSTAGLYKSSNNPSFTVPGSGVVTYFAIYKDTGTGTTSPLIALIDTATGLPFTASSSPTTLNVTMDATNGWFTI